MDKANQNKDLDLIDRLITEWGNVAPHLDTSGMEVVGRLLMLGKILERTANKALQNTDIIYTDLDVLATLRRSGEPYQLTPKQLMQSVLITSGAMTALLGRLTKMSLIERVSVPNDGRSKAAKLTPKGITVIDEAIKLRFDEAKNVANLLNKTEQKQLARLLKKLLNGINA